jgi:hypothetical protein
LRRSGWAVSVRASGGERLVELVDSGEEPIGDGLFGERPEVLGRLQLGAVGRQKDEADALRHDEIGADVPPSAVEHEEDELARPGTDGGGEARQHRREQRGVDRGAGEPLDGAAGRMHEGIEVEPLVAWMRHRDRALAALGPDAADDRLQPCPVLVEGPDLDRAVRRFCPLFFNCLVEVFWKAAWAAAPAARTCCGRGTCSV